jgi:HSP20 family protein
MQTENPNDLTPREKQVTREEGTRQGPYFEPPVDIYETEEALVVTADLPGVDPSDVQTDLRDNLLTITAPTRPVDPKWKPLHQEYPVGHYLRQFRLGQQIDQTKISAELKDGVLTLTLPKTDHARPRRIQIQTK